MYGLDGLRNCFTLQMEMGKIEAIAKIIELVWFISGVPW
jgi:hypothetical protein